MFERFTNQARRVLVHAQEEAKLLGHEWIGSEHILLGILEEQEGVGAQVLTDLGFTAAAVRDQIRRLAGSADEAVYIAARASRIEEAERRTGRQMNPGSTPFSKASKRVLELALREALALHHSDLDTEHLLLGVLREGEGLGAQLLEAGGATPAAVRGRILAKVQAGGAGMPPMLPFVRPPAHTPAMQAILAAAAAGDRPVGSDDVLLAILEHEQSAAARALVSLGVTVDAARAALAEVGTEGTTDHVPADPPVAIEPDAGGITIRVNDPALADKIRRGELGVAFKPPRSDDPPSDDERPGGGRP